MKTPVLLLSLSLSWGGLSASTARATPIPVSSVRQGADGITLEKKPGTLKLEVFSPRVIRVRYGTDANQQPIDSFSVLSKPQRTFRIVWVSPGHGTGLGSTETPDAIVRYTGKALRISARG